MVLFFYKKKDCYLCEEATQFIIINNINNVNEIYVNNFFEVYSKHKDHINEEDMYVSSFPVFYDSTKKMFMDFENMKISFGEPMLLENTNRYVLFPIRYPLLWNMYEKSVASFWTVNEIDFSRDEHDYDNVLNKDERFFINHILAFFAASDGIVNENLARNFSDEVQLSEARAFYSYQQFNETIHSHNYSLMIDRYVKDSEEKKKLFDGVHTIPAVTKKSQWALKWVNKSRCPCFAKRLIGFVCVEGIMFSGSFCAIFWLKKRGLMPGLSFSNELISRDEGNHQDFAVLLYSLLTNKLSQLEVQSIVGEAVDHEKEFIKDAIPCRLVGMNDGLMSTYIEYVADRLLLQLGYMKMYDVKNPFDFMETISLSGKTNFFERRVGEYAKAGMLIDESRQCFAIDDDF
jgi:ribonucleoside-diphosphate reductase beta chain